MKLKIDGHEYKVRFKHTHYEEPIEIPNTQTVAIASTEVNLLSGDKDVVIEKAIAYCSKSDQFSKRRGRKVAFAKMLNECIYDWTNNKKMREEAWKQLQSQCNCMT